MGIGQLIIILILISFLLFAIPIIESANAITVSEVERKLSQAKTQEDVEKVITEILTSKEYQEACKQLSDKLSSLGAPKTQEDAEKALPVLKDYETLNCRYTKNIWGDPPEQLSKTQCDELIIKFEENNRMYYNFRIDDEKTKEEVNYFRDIARETKEVFRHKCMPDPAQCERLDDESSMLNKQYDKAEENSLERKLIRNDLERLNDRISLTCGYLSSLMQYYEEQEKYLNIPSPTIVSSSEIICGKGTIENTFGQCVPDPKHVQEKQSSKGGCLIATATYGSELAPQVQMLREIRDNSLLQTQSGQSFMQGFNEFYYSFSPAIADYERENPVFKEAVKLAITPLISSLSILNYVDMDSEAEVLGYGISLILWNIGMYFVVPAIVIHKVRRML